MFRINAKQIVSVISASVVFLFATNPVFAQLDEITVTAERRQESLQDVPVAVTAFTGEMVESLKISDFHDLSFKIPGFSINTFSKGRGNPALRGGSSSLASAGSENAVGLFIDDVYYGGPNDFEIDIFDVDRIEVLRGPQGTLFGRNATGGLINVVTKNPGEELEGKVQVEMGNYNLNKFGAYVSSPISDNLAASISISSKHRDGTSFNSVTGNDVDNLNRTTVRGKLLWTPSDDLEVKWGLSHGTVDETGVARDAVSDQATVDLDVLAGFEIDGDERTVQMFTDGRYVHEQWVASMHITKDLDNGRTLQSITTGRSFVSDMEPVSLAGVPTAIFAIADEHDSDTFTQEFRLMSGDGSDAALSWQAGVYLLSARDLRDASVITRWDESVTAGVFPSFFGCPDQTMADFENYTVTPSCITDYPELFDENAYTLEEEVKTTSYSAYAQGTYDFSEQLSVTVGGRYTHDKKTLDGATPGDWDWTWNPRPNETFSNSTDWDNFSWKLGMNYRPKESVLLYATASTGFRSGAYDMAQSDGDLIDQAVAPETVTNYELGLKSRFFDNRVQLNIAVFDVTYDNLQFFVNTIGAGEPEGGLSSAGAMTTNAGEATVDGVEVEILWAATDALTMSLSYSKQNGSSKDIPPAAEIPEGTPPQGTVPQSFLFALDYSVDTAKGMRYFHTDYVVKDEYSLEFIDNSIPQFRSQIDGMLNMNFGYKADSGWGIQVWAKNMTDETVILYGQDFWFSLYGESLSNDALFNSAFGPRYSPPRTYGVNFSYEF